MVLNVLTAASSRQPRTNSCSRIDLHALGASDEHNQMNKERGAWLQTRRRCQRGASGSEAGRAERHEAYTPRSSRSRGRVWLHAL